MEKFLAILEFFCLQNVLPEDVLGLTCAQLVVLVSYIIDEATSLVSHDRAVANKNAGSQTSTNQNQGYQSTSTSENSQTSQIPGTIRSRIELLKSCISGKEEKVKALVAHIENMINSKK